MTEKKHLCLTNRNCRAEALWKVNIMKKAKRIIALLLSAVMVFCLTFTASGAEETENEAQDPSLMVTVSDGVVQNGSITAGNNVRTLNSGDVVKFGFTDTFDPMINIKLNFAVNSDEYPILAIKAMRDGTETGGQVFYNEPGQGAVGGKEKNFTWAEGSDWQWLIVDLSGCGTVGYLRFDVFNTANIETTGMIAAVAFFKTVEEADAFASGEEGTALGTHPGEGSVHEEIQREKEMIYSLFDEAGGVDTGWWFNPYMEGLYISFLFESPVWFDHIWFFYYAAPYPTPINVILTDESGNEVFSTLLSVSGNDEYTVPLGTKMHPGEYIITFETTEADEAVSHFVLGSGYMLDDMEIEIEEMNGAQTNENTRDVPAIKLFKCEADPDYTEKPKPTQRPTAEANLPTPVPTSVPTEEPTEVPTESPTEGKAENSNSGSNTGLIIGIAAGVLIIAAAVVTVLLLKKKKNK